MTRGAVRGTVALVVRTIGLQALGFLAFIGLARLIPPADFGLFAIALGVHDVCLVLVTAGFPASLVREQATPSAVDQRAIAGFSLLAAVAVTGLALVISFGLLPAAGEESKAANLIAIATLALPIFAWRVIPFALMVRDLEFERVATIEVVSRIALYIWALGGALMGFGVYALVSAIPVSAVVSAALASRLHPWAGGFSLDFATVARHARFALRVGAVRFLATAFPFSAVAAFGLFGGAALAGFYGLSRRTLGLPASAVAALQRVGFPALSRLVPEMRTRQTARAIAISAVAVSAPLALLAGAADPLVATLFGRRWLPTADIMILTAPGLLVFASVGSAIASRSFADGHTRGPAIAVALQIVTTVGLAAALSAGLDAADVGIAMTAGYVVYGAALVALFHDGETLRAAWCVARTAAVGAGAVAAARALAVDDDLVGLLATGTVAGVTWVALSLILTRRELLALIGLLRRHLGRPSDADEQRDLEVEPEEVA